MFSSVRKCVSLDFLPNKCVVLFSRNKWLHNQPNFTKNVYKVTRGNYNYLHEDHIKYFRHILGENRIIMDLSDLEKYNVDWYLRLRGASSIVLKPKTTEEVSKILSFCNKNRLAVCPQGGNTGVVGGCVPVFDEIIISTELMNEIISLDDTSGVIVCQAGCILQNLDNFLAEKNLMVPIDLGAKGTCQIGGNVSTNAGGLRLLRYGNLHGNVLGLEVVKADGEIIDCLSSLKKDNTGYHLKHLFIGSEGTLGFVTKVAFQCPPRPKSINVAFLGLQKYEKVMKTFQKARNDLGEILSAIEVMDAETMKYVNHTLQLQSPIGHYPFYLLIETSGSNEKHDSDKLSKFFESALNQHYILNGVLATDPSKISAIWQIRERIPEGFAKEGYMFYYDVSLALEHYYTLVDDVRKHMENRSLWVFGFGHLGDCNLHLQVAVPEYSDEIREYLENYSFKRIMELKGSISAEHGLGFMKGKYLYGIKPQPVVNLMSNIKRLLDPNGILNPYKVFPYK